MPPRHQAYCVSNRNARNTAARVGPQPQVSLSSEHATDKSVFELDGRLTLVQERSIEWKVPVRIADRDAPDLDTINNPINQLGALHSRCVPIVTSNDPISYASAVNKRSNFMQADKDDDISPAMLKLSLETIEALPDLFAKNSWDENDTDRVRWLEKFDQGKRTRMERAWDELPTKTKKDLTDKTGSVKIETLVGKRFDKSAAGRIIYAGTDTFNAVTGPAQMVAMERLVQLLAMEVDGEQLKIGKRVQVLLGYKCDDIKLAAFINDPRFKDIVEGDFSRNDREQRSSVAKICRAWMVKIGLPEWYLDLLEILEHYSLTNREFGLKVKLSYQLATGTTNTTFRNSVFNITMFVVTCILQNRRGKALVLGDDLLAALNKRLNCNAWVATVAEFKMVLKAKEQELDGKSTFLSRRIFADVETPFMVPLLGKMLVRFNARANQNQSISDSQAMAAKALSYAFGCKNIHCLRDIFLKRFRMEDDSASVDIADLGWSARSLGYTADDIMRRTEAAPNLIDMDDFSFWCSKVYDLDSVDVLELFEATILCTDPVILEDDRINNMSMDFD